jgi:hypothetical protein
VLDVDGEGSEPATAKSGNAGCLDRRRGSRQDLRRLEVAMQVTCGGAAAVLEVGEEEPGGAMKTMCGWRHPAPREVVQWKPATSLRGDGDDPVQRRYGPMGRRSCRARVGVAA